MMPLRWPVALPLGATLAAAAWLASASALFIPVAGLTMPGTPIAYSPLLWAQAWPSRALSWRIAVPLAASGAVPSAPILAFGFLFARRAWRRRLGPALKPAAPGRVEPVIRGGSDNHGHADWMPMAHALATLRPSGNLPALVIGQAPGEAATAPLLFDPCAHGPTHSLIFAGSGGFKTSAAITRMLCWTGNAIVLDPSREIGPMVEAARAAMNQAVVSIRPGGAGLDILGAIDPAAPNASRRILSVVASICGEEPERHENSVFSDAGRNMVACLISHILYDPDLAADARTLAYFREIITTPEDKMKARLAGIAKNSPSSLARLTASTLMGLAEETFSGGYFNATQFTSWLFDDAIATLLSSGKMRARDAVAGPMTVFIQIPLDVLLTTPAVARVLLDAFAWAFIEADGHYHARTLLLIDEASKIGRMKSIEIVRDTGRKYGLTIQALFLSEAELTDVWGRQGIARWFANVSWRAYGAIADRDTARALADELGTFGALASSEGDNTGQSTRGLDLSTRSRGGNTSTHEISRRLMLAPELMQARSDELFVLRAGDPPLRLAAAPYFRRPDLAAKVAANRFVREPIKETT